MDERIKMVIAVRKELNMRMGKVAAQVGHAVTLYYEYYNSLVCEACESPVPFGSVSFPRHKIWINTGYTKIVVSVGTEDKLLALIETAKNNAVPYYPVYDFGLTEFHGTKTLTCCGFGPCEESNLEFTKHLKLL